MDDSPIETTLLVAEQGFAGRATPPFNGINGDAYASWHDGAFA